MSNGLLTEQPPVAKRTTKDSQLNDQHPSFGRIELQAPPSWIVKLDKAAAAAGLSRSAYIRLACNRLMTEDKARGQA